MKKYYTDSAVWIYWVLISSTFLLTHMWVLVEKDKYISAWICKDKQALLHSLLESNVNKEHLQACRNGKTAYSPLGRLAKSLTSISFVLLARSSFSSDKKSFWKLWGAGKIPSVIATLLSCGKWDCLCTDSVGKCTEQSESHQYPTNQTEKVLSYWKIFTNPVNQSLHYGQTCYNTTTNHLNTSRAKARNR